mgnify:CR=1 FL=1
MVKKYYDKFLVWQLMYRREIVCFIGGLITGAILL